MADATINMNQVKTRIAEMFGGLKINKAVAQTLGITGEQFDKAQTDQDVTTLTIEEAVEDEDIFANFVSMCIAEDEKVTAEPDEEKEHNRPVEQKGQKKS